MITLQPVSTSDGRAFYDMLQRIRPENGFENSAFTMDYADFPAWLAKRVDMSQGAVGVQSPIETKPPAYGRRAELLLSAELTCAPQERQGVLGLTG